MMNQKLNKKKVYLIFSLCLLLLLSMGLILVKINSFMEAYEECKDDFYMIDKCGCLPLEGNYSYFINKMNLNDRNKLNLRQLNISILP